MFSKIKLCSGCGHPVDNHSVYKEKCLTTGGCACREYEGDGYESALLLEERGKSWGNASATHARIAQVWSGILDHPVTAGQVALCMTGLKLVRGSINPDDPDSFDDGQGYLSIAKDIYGHEMLKPEKKPVLCQDFYCANGVTVHNHGDACTDTCLVCRGVA